MADIKAAEAKAKELVATGDVAEVAKIIAENERLKQPRAAQLRTTDAKE